MSVPSIPQFFANKRILITGGTGFLGKVLVEKLLRCCPKIDKIYLLIRSQKGKNPKTRFEEITNLPLYAVLKKDNPNVFKKVVPLEGDVTKLKLGLSPEDYQTLAQHVSIIFHVAASVRFDDELPEAVRMNTRGTQEVVNLALEMKKITGLLYVSTTYCNCDRKIVDEIVYPPQADWREIIKIIEKVDPAIVNILTPKILGRMPNTYTFTKSLSEHVIMSHKEKLPVMIFRPSIVINSWKDPISGWIDNVNGPVGLMLGAGKGVIRTNIIDPDAVPDYMPVDIAAKAMITALWKGAVYSSPDDKLTVYNCSSMTKSISMRNLMGIAFEAFWKNPMHDILWTPTAHFCQNETWLFVNILFKHLIPAIIVDTVFKLTGKEPMLVRLHRKVYKAMMSLSYFTLREWKFINENFLQLNDIILREDRPDFDYDFSMIDPKSFFENAMVGGRQYLLHEDISKNKEAKSKAYRIYWLDKTLRVSSILLFLWIFNVPQLWQYLKTYITS